MVFVLKLWTTKYSSIQHLCCYCIRVVCIYVMTFFYLFQQCLEHLFWFPWFVILDTFYIQGLWTCFSTRDWIYLNGGRETFQFLHNLFWADQHKKHTLLYLKSCYEFNEYKLQVPMKYMKRNCSAEMKVNVVGVNHDGEFQIKRDGRSHNHETFQDSRH
jgi:hypothetical protein